MQNEQAPNKLTDQSISQIYIDITQELDRAEAKFPNWPCDIIHATSIVAEESGEATRAALQLVYEGGSIDDLRKELIQTSAMCFRLLNAIDAGVYDDE